MTVTVIGLLRFGVHWSLAYAVSVLFAGIETHEEKQAHYGLLALFFFLFRPLLWFLGLDLHQALSADYPLPLIVISPLLKRPWLISAVTCFPAIFAVTPSWVRFLRGYLDNRLADLICLLRLCFCSTISKKVCGRSVRSYGGFSNLLINGAGYRFFTIFSTSLPHLHRCAYRGQNGGAVHALKISVFFLCLYLYYAETQKQTALPRERG